MRRSGNCGQLHLLLSTICIALSASSVMGQQIPAPYQGGPRPDIQLNRSTIRIGEPIVVSGTAPPGFDVVRVNLMIDSDGDGQLDRTQALDTAEVVNGAFSIEVAWEDAVDGMPSLTGLIKIAVVVEGAPEAEFGTANVSVLPASAARITGSLPESVSVTGPAFAELVSTTTLQTVQRVPIQVDGSYSITGITPGKYDLHFTGKIDAPVESIPGIGLGPDDALAFAPDILACFSSDVFNSSSISYVTGTPSADLSSTISSAWVSSGFDPPNRGVNEFGQYVANSDGPSPVVTFRAAVQDRGPGAAGVRFQIVAPNGTIRWQAEDFSPDAQGYYSADCDVIGTALTQRTHELRAYVLRDANDNGDYIECLGFTGDIRMVQNPATTDLFDGEVRWDAGRGHYRFEGFTPDFGILEYFFPSADFEIPVLGPAASGYEAGVFIKGTLDLDGRVRILRWRAEFRVDLLGQTIYEETQRLLPDEEDDSNSLFTPTEFFVFADDGGVQDPAEFEIVSDAIELFDITEAWEVFSGTLWTFFGIVSVNASIDLGLDAMLELAIGEKPFEPELNATLTPTVEPSVTLSIWVELLLGLAKGGADARANAFLDWPVTFALDADQDLSIRADDPCLGIKVVLEAWAKFLAKTWEIGSFELFCADNAGCFCGSARASTQTTDQGNAPNEMAVPHVAVGPGGRRLMVWAETTGAPGLEELQIVARHWNRTSQEWGPAETITPTGRAATDPVVAYFGAGGDAVVIFTTNRLDESAGPVTSDISTILRNQEIASVRWNETTGLWSTVTLLTNDTVADGSPAVAGSNTGYTVAWTRDTVDGTPLTQNDWLIAVQHFRPGFGFSALSLLDSAAAFAAAGVPGARPLNTEVDVYRDGDQIALAWTADHDADVSTNGNRRIAVARGVPAPGTAQFYNFNVSVIDSLHGPDGWSVSGASQPSVVLELPADIIHVAYVSRGLDADGVTETGVGNNNELWHAQATPGGGWTDERLTEAGATILAEKPELAFDSDGSLILLSRVFGGMANGVNMFRGQLAMMQFDPLMQSWSPRVFVTDGEDQQWQQDLVIDPLNGDAIVTSVSRALDGALSPSAPSGVMPAVDVFAAKAGGDPVESRIQPPNPELALSLAVPSDQLHGPVGSTVEVTVTVTNVGRRAISGVSIEGFRGPSAAGPLVGRLDLTEPIGVFQTIEWTLLVVRQSTTSELITVRVGGDSVSAEFPELYLDNNIATIDIGLLLIAETLTVRPSSITPNGVTIACDPPNQADLGGFRWLRSDSPSGPFSNVGETTVPVFYDTLPPDTGSVYYKVQVFDTSGLLSPPTPAVQLLRPDVRELATQGVSGNWNDPTVWGEPTPDQGDNVTWVYEPGGITITATDDIETGSIAFGQLPAQSGRGADLVRSIDSAPQILDLSGFNMTLTKPLEIGEAGVLRMAGGALDVNQAWLRSNGSVEISGDGSSIVGIAEIAGTLGIHGASGALKPSLLLTEARLNGSATCTSDARDEATLVQINRLEIGPEGRWTFTGAADGEHTIVGDVRSSGVIEVDQATVLEGLVESDALVNFGQIAVRDVLMLDYVSDPQLHNWGTLEITPGSAVVSSQAGMLNTVGDLDVRQGAMLSIVGDIKVTGGSLSIAAGAEVQAGRVVVEDAFINLGGVVRGQVDLAGTLGPGDAIETEFGIASVIGALHCDPASAVVRLDIGGGAPGATFDQLRVTSDPGGAQSFGAGVAELAGSLEIRLRDEFVPFNGQVFEIVVASEVQGTFDETSYQGLPAGVSGVVSYRSDAVTVRFVGGPPRSIGDVNGDGAVDVEDGLALTLCIDGPETSPRAECLNADVDSDGDADLSDIAAIQALLSAP